MIDDVAALRKVASADRALVPTFDATSNTDLLGEAEARGRFLVLKFALSGNKPGPVGQSSDGVSPILAAAIDD